MSSPLQTAAATMALTLAIAAPVSASADPALRVVRDPSGELRAPTAAEAAAFEKAEAQLREKRTGQQAKRNVNVEIRHPDGSVETPLGEDSMMFSVVRSADDGTLTTACLPAKEAKRFVQSSARTSAAKTEAKAGHAHP